MSGGRFQTFEVAITAKNGSFKTQTRPGRTYLYRARVSQTARCMGATSKAAKVVSQAVDRGPPLSGRRADEKPLYMRLCLWYPRSTRDALGGGR